MQWQRALLDQIGVASPAVDAVRPYGSVLTPSELDRWSDLDAEVDLSADVEGGKLLGAELWAWQSSLDDDIQRVRAVLRDGRRCDLALRGAILTLPQPPVDNAVRFDLALAATRFGRGANAIGLHLTLGVVREALVHSMVLADRQSGSAHHRSGTPTDVVAAEALALLSTAPMPALTLRVAEFYAESRARIEADYEPDWSGLTAIVTPSS
ncbi:hypothetical protein QUG92_15945 [Curtobacterium sp. RHCKG23]|uniref:Nucleotidyltransferase-like protein n=1 Tax=Curtobacterium citri TaxID=3055139 RepID=A0ABT7TCG6_9MICO|nr:hypothetical protein [Curtobacterium citri]MDM7886604.1 hypothetical protein [Curtobacterium citri]